MLFCEGRRFAGGWRDKFSVCFHHANYWCSIVVLFSPFGEEPVMRKFEL